MTAEEALSAAVERVCRPYLAGDTTEVRADALSTAAGFRRASRTEALEGIGEDYVANLAQTSNGRVTLDFNLSIGDRGCGVSVMGEPQMFDFYIEKLSASGWTPAGPPISVEGGRVEWLWAPDATVTLVVERLDDISLVGPHRVLGLSLTKGMQPIPPECGRDQRPPCRLY